MQLQITHSVVGARPPADLVATLESNNSTADQANQLPVEWDERRLIVLAVMPTTAACTEVASRLGDSGYGLCTACTTHHALELAEQPLVDVVMLDLDGHYEAGKDGMVISGFRLLHLLWRLTRGRPVALVVISAMDYTEVEGAVRASADDFINKPVGTTQLTSRLRGALGRVRTRARERAEVAYQHQTAGWAC